MSKDFEYIYIPNSIAAFPSQHSHAKKPHLLKDNIHSESDIVPEKEKNPARSLEGRERKLPVTLLKKIFDDGCESVLSSGHKNSTGSYGNLFNIRASNSV